jgi:hypothetical protein
VDDQIRAFLGRTYNLKAIADYHTGPGSHLSADMAREAIDSARHFVDRIAAIIPVQQADLSLAERLGYNAARNPDVRSEEDSERDHDLEHEP